MDVQTIKLSQRTVEGKKVKHLRRQGLVPVHVYGRDLDPKSLQVEAQVLRRILPRVGTNVPLSVKIEGQKGDSICFVREVQRHPVTEDVLHVDFMRVDVKRTIRVEVPVILVGSAPAVGNLGGTLLQPAQTVLVESLPMSIPPSFEIEVSGLDDFEKSIHVSDIPGDPEVIVLTDPEELVARVAPPRIEVVEEEEAKEELAEGVEAAAEGVEEGAEGETPSEEQPAWGKAPRERNR